MNNASGPDPVADNDRPSPASKPTEQSPGRHAQPSGSQYPLGRSTAEKVVQLLVWLVGLVFFAFCAFVLSRYFGRDLGKKGILIGWGLGLMLIFAYFSAWPILSAIVSILFERASSCRSRNRE